MTELFHYIFFQNALTGCCLAGIVCGLVGTYIVSHRIVFMAGGIAHASLGGVGICALAGWPPIAGAAVFSVLMSFVVQKLSRRKEVRKDSAIAMLWAFGMSIGIICTYLSPSFLPDLTGYLFGNILLIHAGDLAFLAALAIVSILVFLLFIPQITAVSFDREFARSQGLPTSLIEYGMMFLIALSVVACLRVAGVVMVISLLSIPQMTANLFTRNFSTMAVLSTFIAIFCCFFGLLFSYYYNIPSGATIILFSIIIYALLRTIKAVSSGFNRRKKHL